MQRRIFIALNLPIETVIALEKEAEQIRAAFLSQVVKTLRFVPPGNMHITVLFLGEQNEAAMVNTVAVLQNVARHHAPSHITFERIAYGPIGRTPRMVWAITDHKTSATISKIKDALIPPLVEAGVFFGVEHRQFTGHLTLMRFLPIRDLPPIDRPLTLSCTTHSIDLMESKLMRGRAEYNMLQRTPFGLHPDR